MHKAPRGGGLCDQGDPHLRSVTAIIVTQVCATDGLAGHVQAVLAERSGWAIANIVVDTTAWLAEARHVMVSPSSVAEISW